MYALYNLKKNKELLLDATIKEHNNYIVRQKLVLNCCVLILRSVRDRIGDVN